MGLSHINYGDVPNWLLVVITAFAVVSAGRILRIERNRDNAASDERKKAQASLVSAWAVVRTHTPQSLQAPNYYVAVLCHNGSDQPIHEVSVFMFMEGKPLGLEDGTRLIPPNNQELLEVLRSELAAPMRFHSESEYLTVEEAESAVVEILTEVHFTDAGGRRWSRGVDGQLHLKQDGDDRHWLRGDDGLLHLYEDGKDVDQINP